MHAIAILVTVVMADNVIVLSDTDEDEPKVATVHPVATAPTVATVSTVATAPQLAYQTAPLHIVCISDTHGEHDRVEVPAPPSATSVLVHCGDFESASKLEAWLQRPPQSAYAYKLVVCGNHDTTHKKLDALPGGAHAAVAADYDAGLAASVRLQERAGIQNKSTIRSAMLLHNSGVFICGRLFFGTPYHAHDPANTSLNNRHFERSEEVLATMHASIPRQTDVLLSHAGPHGILDSTGADKLLGSRSLLAAVQSLPQLKAHVFGHVHATSPRRI